MRQAAVLYRQFRSAELPAETFSHTSHIRLGWYYLNRWPLPAAVRRFSRDLRAYVEQVGATGKYHHTITVALLRLMHSHLAALENPTDWQAFRHDAKPLFHDAEKMLARFYSPELLASEAARQGWQDPDRCPLPASPDDNTT